MFYIVRTANINIISIFKGTFGGISIGNYALRAIPPTPSERAPPVHSDTGVDGFRYRYPQKFARLEGFSDGQYAG